MRVVLISVLIAVSAGSAFAHKPSDAHLQVVIAGDRVSGSLAVAIRDLDGALDLDFDGNGDVTWVEMTTAAPRVATYAGERLVIASGGTPCTFTFGAGVLVDFSDGAYWTMTVNGVCTSTPESLVVTYGLLFEIDAQHRGIVQIKSAGTSKTVVARDGTPITIQLEPSSGWTFFKAGIRNLLGSLHHLAFVACLLLPCIVRRRSRGRQPDESWRELVRGVAPILAVFTLANVATLLLSASGLVGLPPPVVELGLALSLALVASLALLRLSVDLSFEVGLVRGLGFALWLHHLAPPAHRLGPVAGFGIGLVLGQTVCVAVLAAVLFAVRRTIVPQILLWAVAAVAEIAAIIWTLQLLFG